MKKVILLLGSLVYLPFLAHEDPDGFYTVIHNTCKYQVLACVFFNFPKGSEKPLRLCFVDSQQTIAIRYSFDQKWQQGFIKFLWNNSSRGYIFPTKNHEMWRLYQDGYGNIEFGVSSVSDHAKKAFYSKSI